MAKVAVGIDLGTSGIKAVALSEDGRLLARARRNYPTSRPSFGAAEQSPADWEDALISVLHELSQHVPASSWIAIGLAAMLPTLVALDTAGNPIGPAVVWEDSRAEAEGKAFRSRAGAERLYRVTGQLVDGRYLVPMHERRVHQENPRSVHTVAGAKDYLFQLLTGELLTDPSTAAGFGLYDLATGDWSDELLSATEIPGLPPVAPSAEQRPMLQALCAEFGCQPGLPVVLGGADSVLGAYGLGVTAPGEVAYIAGTSNVILGFAATALLDPAQRYLVTPLVGDGFGLEMDLLATGSAMAWLAGLFGLGGGAAELAELAREVPVTEAPVFLPHLAPGEQGALWDPSLSGTIHGLNQHMGRAHLARGLLSGIIVESRRCLAVLDEALPVGAQLPIRLSGSSGGSERFRQDLADATGRPVRYFPGSSDHSGLGAGLLAGRAAEGWEVQLELESRTVDPDYSAMGIWNELASLQDETRRGLSGVHPLERNKRR